MNCGFNSSIPSPFPSPFSSGEPSSVGGDASCSGSSGAGSSGASSAGAASSSGLASSGAASSGFTPSSVGSAVLAGSWGGVVASDDSIDIFSISCFPRY